MKKNRKIPFFDYTKLWTEEREDLINIIDRVASSGGFIMQDDLKSFENNLANYSDSNFAVGVGNATDGMEIFLQAIGLNRGDEIIISSHTMLATASAVIMAGGKPVPVDIDEDNLINPDAIESAITENTVGIMPTQLNGRICKMDKIKSIADRKKLFLVEDAAQALGAKYKGKHAGTFGLASSISFFPAKVMGSLGDAGGVLAQDADLYEKIYELHDHGRNSLGEVIRWGRNSRLDNIQAAILNFKFTNYSKVINRRREIANIYHEYLSDITELKLPNPPCKNSDNFDVFQNYELEADNRDLLKEYLSKNNIGTLIQWGGYAVHHHKNLGFNIELEKCDRFFQKCIMLPMNTFISNSDVKHISNKIREFYRR